MLIMLAVFSHLSDQIQMRLEEFPCAGVVRFTTDGQNYSGYICAEGETHQSDEYGL